MAGPSQLIQHVESFVDSSRSPTQQAASLDAIASLLKSDTLTIEALVKEMGMYLTTTDNLIRARGILLLAELLTCLASNPLDNATIHSLIGFFTDRLADWKALRGALVGCLALLRRKSSAGVVTSSDARAVAQSYLQNLQVQSLGQHDRKLCFELLECLLDHYPDAVAALGDDLVYGICEAIDGERDPHCLMLTFHIVEVLARLFPDPLGPLASFAGDLFDILGCYFPIHFTHPKSEDIDVKRDDLSRALMLAFSSTPLFEPFAIPLLLQKLSSTLLLAKVDSLKFLSNCTLKFGADRMAKHAEAIWSSLKNAIYASQQEPILSLTSESLDGMHFQESEIAKEGLILLQKVILQDNGLYISLIVGDEDINMIIKSITSFKSYNDIPLQSKQKLHAVGCILYVSAKASIASCNRVFESFFLHLMDTLGLSVNSSGTSFPNDNYVISEKLNFGALYLCIELLAACRDMIFGFEEPTSKFDSAHETWCFMLHDFSGSLIKAFSSTLVTSLNEGTHDADIYAGVRGLQILAMFPGDFSPISKSLVENILMTFTSIITTDCNNTLLWRQALKALVKIGSFIDRYHESEKTLSYMCMVVEKIISLTSFEDFNMPLPLKLEAICEIGATGLNFMLRVVQGLEAAISANLSDVYVQGNSKTPEVVVQLLECFSNKVLPWCLQTGCSEEVPLHFAINIWNQIENIMAFSDKVQGKELLHATMTAMKLAVATCSEENQTNILEKAYSVLLSSNSFPLKESMFATIPVQLEGLQLTQDSDNLSSRDEWLISLFASVIIAIRPQTHIRNVRVITHLFMKALLKGNVPSAQALGSMVNKLHPKNNEAEISGDCSLEEAMDIIFNKSFWSSYDNGPLRSCSVLGDHNEAGLMKLCLSVESRSLLQIHAIVGLAWVGKGLLMRGHEKVKDVTMIFFKCLMSNVETGALPLEQNSVENCPEKDMILSMMKSAADAFHILMSDSEVCLNKRFHAIMRPLYKQRFFSTVMPILLPSIVKSDSSIRRSMMYRAFGHVISDTPLVAILSEVNKLIPILLDGLSTLSGDVVDKDMIYSLLLVLSGILMDKNGQEAVVENAHIIINCLTGLVSYPHMMLVRETAVQCLVAMSGLPHSRIYPMRSQVLIAISKALDDPKRAVRQEAIRCRQAWASTASRSLHF